MLTRGSAEDAAKTLLLVDGSSYLYRAFHALPDLRNRAAEPTGAVYGVLNMLRRLKKDVPADYAACVFDAKGPTFRDALYPQYKANRPSMPDDLAAQITPLHEAAAAMGWPVLVVDGVEADDVIGTLACAAQQAALHTVISTGDKDLAQLVNPHVTLVNTMSNETIDVPGVEAKFGVGPDCIIDYLTLVGDAVDNIPGVAKVGPKTAVKWLAQYGTLENLIAHAAEIKGAVGDNLRAALDWLPQARELVTIKCNVELPLGIEHLKWRATDVVTLARLFEHLEFKSWLRELQAGAPGATDQESKSPRPPFFKGGQAQVVLPFEKRGQAEQEVVPPFEKGGPGGISDGSQANASPRHYETILTAAQLDPWLARLDAAPLTALDTETTSLDEMRAELVGISLSIEPHHAAYLPLAHRYAGAPPQLDRAAVLEKLRPWLEAADKPKLGQNLKYDMHVFANYGITVRGVVHDTLLESFVLESHKPHDMDSLARRHLGVETITYNDVTGKGASRIGFEQVAVERATEYSGEDADVTLQLHQALYPAIDADEKLLEVYRDIEMPVLDVLFTMERNGVLLDVDLLARLSHEFGARMAEFEAAAHELAGQPFNLNSPKQIQEILFTQQKLPTVKKTPSGQPSTDEDVLQRLALDYPLPKKILEYRALTKLKSTYTDKLPRMVHPRSGRVHTHYAQSGAATGRLASSDPNLQNIPVRTTDGRRIRAAFIAAPGSRIVSADYSQVELRIMAHISQDASLLAAFAAGHDIHRATASEIFSIAAEQIDAEQRRYAKVINFGLIYGMSAFGLASQIGIERAAAQQYMDRYFARYPGVAEYMKRTREQARERGYVETIFGRRLWLPDIRAAGGPRRQGAERAAINAPMQGTAADLIKLAMAAVQHWLDRRRLGAKLIMQVHDELVLEVPENELDEVRVELSALMSGVAKLDVPLVVDVGVGANWDEAH